MKRSCRWLTLCAFAAMSVVAFAQARDNALPHLEKRGRATQLIVDGKPFLVLGGHESVRAPQSRLTRILAGV